MSNQLTSHSPDTQQLLNEGFEIEFKAEYLLVKHVPYLNSKKEVRYGMLVCETALDGNSRPSNHTIYFQGEYPHNADGRPMDNVVNSPHNSPLAGGLNVNFLLSSKPNTGYQSIHQKVTNYVSLLSAPAVVVDKSVTARTYAVIDVLDPASPFKYGDTASTRAEIMQHTEKLMLEKIAIIGLGGTGSYVFDLVAKTPVKEIHLIDGDRFSQHNAFRAPGAASREEIESGISKVAYFKSKYKALRDGIITHEHYITAESLPLLDGMDFVFICIDRGEIKNQIIKALDEASTPFIDVGMGIQADEKGVHGILRVTTSTKEARGHIHEKKLIPVSDNGNDAYSRNIQIADLNARNAADAVIRWKKMCGFYRDDESELHSLYSIRGNTVSNRLGLRE